MRILIIGGTGFLGYHITKHLLDEGQEITLFNRGKTPDDFGTKVERISGDRYDGASFHNQLSGKSFDAVVDMISYQAADSQLAVRTFSGKIDHYIHISTAAVYIITKDYPCPLREEDFDRELYPKSRRKSGLWTYGYNKRKCEEVLFRAFKEHGFPVTIFRLPIVMGGRDHTLRPYSYFIRILDGKPLIVPDGSLN
ncbi:MAG: NAD-dependent epimerase/dehydratase family protein, partial [Candidatus Aminicenantales bacterium]